MDYYNDQIMENLIRKKNGLPFVHVDLASFNAGAATKLAAAVNGGQSLADTGQTQTTHLGSVTTTVVGTVARVATRPFTFSVSPERDENLTINTITALGNGAVYQAYEDFPEDNVREVDIGNLPRYVPDRKSVV